MGGLLFNPVGRHQCLFPPHLTSRSAPKNGVSGEAPPQEASRQTSQALLSKVGTVRNTISCLNVVSRKEKKKKMLRSNYPDVQEWIDPQPAAVWIPASLSEWHRRTEAETVSGWGCFGSTAPSAPSAHQRPFFVIGPSKSAKPGVLHTKWRTWVWLLHKRFTLCFRDGHQPHRHIQILHSK